MRRCAASRSHTALVAVLTLLLPAFLAAAPLTLSDVFEIEQVADPQISPDGRTVVYVRTAADKMSDRWVSQLWQLVLEGEDAGQHRPLTTGKRSASSPRFSPDGKRLAYVSSGFEGSEDDSSQIWVRYLDTGASHQLTHHEHPPSEIVWSPDGERIAFVALVPRSPDPIAELPAAPSGAEWADPPKVIDRLFYKFDPVGYLPDGHWHLFVVPSGGGTARQLTTGEHSFGGPSLRGGGGPAFSPDGRSLLVSANLRPESDLEPLDTEVYEISLETGEHRALTSRRGPDNSVVISPDGRQIAYLGYDDRYQGFQLTNLYLADRDGSSPRQLASGLGRSIESVSFAPDGDALVITYTSEGRSRIALVDPRSGKASELAADVGGGLSAYAGAGAFSISDDGRIALVASSESSPGDVAVLEPDGELRVLTSVNDDLFSQRELATLEEIWFDSSHDGRKVQGWILKPPGFDPAQKYPLILEIHGGPFAAYGPRFDMEKQQMAARGYVVLYTNPRGSTSYGEEFGNLIHHAYPGDDFHDLMSGVDAVIERGYVDPEQLYVTGGSGGGVLTSWVIGRSDRFRAAVTVYPVINWYSWVLTADIAAFGVRYWFPGFPWDHAEHYESRSLLSVVENVTTPTMVLTGEADYRTPMSDSEQYFTALRLLGVESVLVRYPEENHGIRRRPSHWMGKIGHIIGWMERHRGD
ncbi:MAG: S9 family peptidase [Acidobacteria bacterium]|nr:MAG: S9 family peptidase [Acidobacteriota bacterium]REK03227.1 MAG: S9 family peptidase [Acidobacteriota bacterium]